jgi:phenylpyruvate tautomerase PptA (4-oxalocrotonate tautomerase family)
MPYLRIQTNLPLNKKAEHTMLIQASTLVAAELGKPEEYVMVAVQPDTPMVFAGSDDPAAFVELKGIGLPASKTKHLSQVLSSLINQHLGIPIDRVFLNFADVPPNLWGWNGDTF